MSRLFIDDKELRFFNCINKELIQKIVGQKIIYYSVSLEHTKVDDLYGEAVSKTVFNPVEVNALVLYGEPEQVNNQFGIDTLYSLEVYFFEEELRERNLKPQSGDFVKFGSITYEINAITKPQITYGQIENKVMTKAVCNVARESQISLKDNLEGI